MTLRFLLDTNVVVRWFAEPKKLSRQQARICGEAMRRGEPLAISGVTLVEIAILLSDGRYRVNASMADLFAVLELNPIFRVLPITIPIALDAGGLSVLRDPADRTIVATARVHGLRLLTSDQRIISSKLVSFID